MAAVVTHPLDLAKARMQTAKTPPKGMIHTLISVVKNEGVLAAYDGLSASILRQATYTTVRLGAYEKLKELVNPHYNGQAPSYVLLPLSMVSGLAGSFVGNPSDIVNVRMQNDRAAAPEHRRNYKNALDGVWRIFREEGPRTLLKGFGPNAVRGVLMTASQVVSYDEAKRLLVNLGMHPTSQATFFGASTVAGLVATTVCSPADVIKTLVMHAPKDHHEPIGSLVMSKYRQEGLRFFFRGWTPAFIRLGPQTIVIFVVMEELKKWKVGVH